jgi:hypothetical protein
VAAPSTLPLSAYTPDSDIAFVAASGPELEAYLLSREVYWPLTQPRGQVALPRLTLGGLLLALRRLSAVERDLTPDEGAILARARSRIEAERQRWASGAAAKVAAEAHARLNLWRAYLQDLADSPARQAELYAGEVRQRAMLQVLMTAAEGTGFPEAARGEIEALDALLRRSFGAGSFVWAQRLAPAFPPREYWFLYGWPQNS